MRVKFARDKVKPGKPIVVRTTEAERKKIEEKAKTYTGGDVSKWVRFSSMNFVPKKVHLEND